MKALVSLWSRMGLGWAVTTLTVSSPTRAMLAMVEQLLFRAEVGWLRARSRE